MRLLFVSKRYPQQRDLLKRPYGRFFHLPTELARQGNDVRVVLLGHRNEPGADTEHAGVQWQARDLRKEGPLTLMGRLQAETIQWQPDWVIGCSDAWTACLAQRLATRSGARLAVDAYDDFESYMPWNLPLHSLYRRTLHSASLVTAAGPQLAAHLARHRRHPGDVEVLPMAADPAFQPLDRNECRQALGLPLEVPVLGYSGGWGNARGTEMLAPAFAQVRAALPGALLALTGRPPESIVCQTGVVALGYLDDAQLPTFTNAVDVACVITADTRFGRSSYPAKLCEAMACGTTVIATDTAPVRWMLSHAPGRLVPAGDVDAFRAAAIPSLSLPRVDYGLLPTWGSVAQSFHTLLTERMT